MSLTLGVHVSIAGKIHYAVDRASALGVNTMQIFARNPRQWRKSAVGDEDIALFKKKVKAAHIKPVVIHVPYTLNLATSKKKFYEITIREFVTDLKEADRLGAQYFVTHMGSYKGTTETNGLGKITTALNRILESTPEVKTQVLLENTAGSGQWLGYNFMQARYVLDNIAFPARRIGLCLDTAHAWTAGYRIDKEQGLQDMVDELDREVGLKRLKVIHLNDTKEAFGSHHDRHSHIGEGLITQKGFSNVVNHPALRDIPFILETPKDDELDDIKNLNVIRKLYKK